MTRFGDCARAGRPAWTTLAIAAVLVACSGDGTTPAHPLPAIESLTPTLVPEGGPEFILFVNGTDFVEGSVVLLDGTARPTQFVSRVELRATILAGDLTSGRVASVVVSNPPPGGGDSNAAQLRIGQWSSQQPTLTSVSPEEVLAGGGDTIVTIIGTGFSPDSRALFGGHVKVPTFISDVELRATLTEADRADTGLFWVRVENPGPGGGTSGGAPLTVLAPEPMLSAIDPVKTNAGQQSLVVRMHGSGFIPSSQGFFGDHARPTRFVSPQELEVTLGEADLQSPGTFRLTVRNPPPGGGTSPVAELDLLNPEP